MNRGEMWHCLPSAGARSVQLREVWPCFHSTRCSKESLGASRVPVLLSFFFLLLLLLLFFFFQHAARFISSSNSTLSSKPAYKSRFITYLPILLLLAELAAGSRLRALQALLRSFPSPSASPALPAFPRRKVPALLFPRFPGLAAGV